MERNANSEKGVALVEVALLLALLAVALIGSLTAFRSSVQGKFDDASVCIVSQDPMDCQAMNTGGGIEGRTDP